MVTCLLLQRGSLKTQLAVLNKQLEPAQISFTLKSATWTTTKSLPDFADGFSSDNLKEQVFKDLHRGKRGTLNLFYFNSTDNYGGSTGLSCNTGVADGIIVNANTVPGSSHPFWNEGKTTVHEVGHWLGWAAHEAADMACGMHTP